jgi:hypothetical protein
MESVSEVAGEIEQVNAVPHEGKKDDEVQEIFNLSDEEKTASLTEEELEKSCDLDKLSVDMREILQRGTQEWGQCIEFECPTASACIKVDKLLSQPHQTVTDPVAVPARQVPKLRELSSKVRDCEDTLSRYGILFEQAVQRIDGQLQYIVNWQRNVNKTNDDVRKKIDALIAEVGLDSIKARLQQMEREPQPRLHHCFGGQRQGRDLEFYVDMPPLPHEQHRRHPMSENSYNRRGRGNRRGGRF